MSMFEGWFFVSKDEQKRRQDALGALVFPFGEEAQKPLIVNALNGLYGDTRKFDSQDQLFAFITAKSKYQEAGGPDSGTSQGNARKQLKKIGWKDENRIRLMLSFLELDAKATSLEDYPTAEDVARHAGITLQ